MRGRRLYDCAKVTTKGSYVLFLAVSTDSLSAGDSLSEHSMTFEFSEFKFTRLAGQTHSVQFKNKKTREGFGLSAKGTRLARSATLIGLQLSLSGPCANLAN